MASPARKGLTRSGSIFFEAGHLKLSAELQDRVGAAEVWCEVQVPYLPVLRTQRVCAARPIDFKFRDGVLLASLTAQQRASLRFIIESRQADVRFVVMMAGAAGPCGVASGQLNLLKCAPPTSRDFERSLLRLTAEGPGASPGKAGSLTVSLSAAEALRTIVDVGTEGETATQVACAVNVETQCTLGQLEEPAAVQGDAVNPMVSRDPPRSPDPPPPHGASLPRRGDAPGRHRDESGSESSSDDDGPTSGGIVDGLRNHGSPILDVSASYARWANVEGGPSSPARSVGARTVDSNTARRRDRLRNEQRFEQRCGAEKAMKELDDQLLKERKLRAKAENELKMKQRRMQQREVELLGELDKFRRALGRYVLEGSEADRLVQAEEELAEAQELEERLRQDLRREREQLAKVTARAEAAEAKLLEDARAEL